MAENWDLEGCQLLSSAIIEQACNDYMSYDFANRKIMKCKIHDYESNSLNAAERSYLSAIRFFEGPLYELLVNTFGFTMSGKEVMKVLDIRKKQVAQ